MLLLVHTGTLILKDVLEAVRAEGRAKSRRQESRNLIILNI